MGLQRSLLLFTLLCTFRHQFGLPVSDICTLANGSLTCIGVQNQNDFPVVLPYDSTTTSAVFVGTEYLLDFPKEPFEHTSWQYLQKLVLQNFVRIESLDENTFSGLWNLIELRITNFTYLEKIDDSAFIVLPKLEILDLSYNGNLSFVSVEALIDNTVPNLRHLLLSRLNHAANKPHIIGKSFASAIGTKNLTHLDVSGANVALIQEIVVESTLANLRYLNLSDTAISLNITDMFQFPNLETLDITRSRYMYVKDILGQSGKIVTRHAKSLKRIYANEIILNHSESDNYSGTIELGVDIPLESMMIQKFGANKAVYNVTFTGVLLNMSKLDLSEGNITYLSPSMLKIFPSLKIAILGGNALGKMENTPDFEALFNGNPQLQQVGLDNNGICQLPEYIFSNNAVLLVIDLHGNHLINFNINLTHQSKIRYLDLSENNLRNLSKSLIDTLESHFNNQIGQSIDVFSSKNLSKVETDFNQDSFKELPTPKTLTLNLAGNPFECDCDSIYLIKWISTTKINLVRKRDLNCAFRGNNLTMGAESLQFMESKCRGSSATAPGIIVTIAVIVPVGVIALVVLAVVIGKKIKKFYVRIDTPEQESLVV